MEDDQTDPEMVLLVLMERAFKGPTHEGVRILDWAPQLKRVLKCVRENDPMTMELRGEIERLRAELAECRAKHMDELLVLSETAKAERESRAELAECKRDAERYRWLRSESCPWPGVFSIEGADDYGWYAICEGDLDQAIDDALAAKEKVK